MANLEIAASRGPRDKRCLAGTRHPNDSNQDLGPGHVLSRHVLGILSEGWKGGQIGSTEEGLKIASFSKRAKGSRNETDSVYRLMEGICG